MRFKTGMWVIVTRRRLDGPEMEMKGKVIEATPDYAVAESWVNVDGERRVIRSTMSEDTAGIISFRRTTQSDWNRRRR